jgi:hypothetical protein
VPIEPSFRPPPEAPESIAIKSWNDARSPIARLLRWNIASAVALSTLIKNLGGGPGGGDTTVNTAGSELHAFLLMGA